MSLDQERVPTPPPHSAGDSVPPSSTRGSDTNTGSERSELEVVVPMREVDEPPMDSSWSPPHKPTPQPSMSISSILNQNPSSVAATSDAGTSEPPSSPGPPAGGGAVREAPAWDSDLEAEENAPLYVAELAVYKDEMDTHRKLLDAAWDEVMRQEQRDMNEQLCGEYAARYLSLSKRLKRPRTAAASDEIDAELLDTLEDTKAQQHRARRVRSSTPDSDDPLAELDAELDEETAYQSGSESPRLITKRARTDEPPPPELIDPETGAVRGPIPIGARRAAMLEEAHRRVWTTIARRDIPKVYRTVQASATNKAMYWRRLSSVVQREAKRGAARNNKSAKDMQLRARKVMRELLLYWKRNEREERELRRKAEKEALERAKKEEEMREAKRQARKLNFLITQTELYSHFVGNKLKTDQAEESEETAGASGVDGAAPAAPAPPAPVRRSADDAPLEEIDFDDEDESNMRAHAARNAEEAVLAARNKAQAFDAAVAHERRNPEGETANGAPAEGTQFDADDMNFLNPSSMGMTEVQQPKMLTCPLKPYQLKGLSWLANLYEQGINGILADEMGLGKTVQSIALMAYLAEVHDIWGPFLIIAPASTLHNWQQEITRFVPQLKALPYWGNVKDRAVLRKFWNRKQISYDRDAPFHVLVTSYQLVVTDEKYFQRLKWQYMVLDEAQAIKSSSSARWKTLLGFNCRNRLLLTGTPVQNSMQELWALLHFIMPSLFDSHDEFSEWFSKDIESHAENKGTLNEHQLRRLHMILKPFMLRRIKKNVQNELGDKIEIDLYCDLSARQKMLYRALRSHVSVAELMDKVNASDESGLKSLMNLVMQFRKVCNHPELFERADVQAPFVVGSFAQKHAPVRDGEQLYCPDSARSLLDVRVPRLLARDGGLLDVPTPENRAGFDTRYLDNLLNIWRTPHVAESLRERDSAFSFLPLLRLGAADAERTFHGGDLRRLLDAAAFEQTLRDEGHLRYDDELAAAALRPLAEVRRPVPYAAARPAPCVAPLGIVRDAVVPTRFLNTLRAAIQPAVAPRMRLHADDRTFVERQERFAHDQDTSLMHFGLPAPRCEAPEAVAAMHKRVSPAVPPHGLASRSSALQLWHSPIQVPQMDKLIVDSSKLARLDSLLRDLKAGGHRVLIYFQMTKMIDLMEEYLIYRQYKYLRLDGASKISDRRDMVTDWQTRPELFVFLLSTRAGGLGINLTAADTVIFFDHDWNPSNDSQAMDRAHRLGQTKQVTVYRLITQGTIDERIVKLARNKKEVQDIVVGNKAYSETGMAKPQEIVSLLLDDDELAESMLRRKQADEAQLALDKAENARAMHARRRLNKAQAAEAAANVSEAPGLNWALEDDEDDFFGAKPPPAEDEVDDVQPEAPKKRSKTKKGADANGEPHGTSPKRARKPRKRAAEQPQDAAQDAD